MTASSAYAIAYEAALTDLVGEYISEHENDAASAYAGITKAIEEKRGDGYQGPIARHMAWNLDKIIRAEYTTNVTVALKFYMSQDRDREPMTATEAMAQVIRDAERAVKDGITSSSSGRFHNTVAQSVGEAALETVLHDGSWSGFKTLQSRAEHAANDAVTPDDLKTYRTNARIAIRDLEGKLGSARSEAKKHEHRMSLQLAKDLMAANDAKIADAIAAAKR